MGSNNLIGAVATGLLLAACGGDGDGGADPGSGTGPTASERSAMVTALNAAATNATAAGDGAGILVLKGAAGLIGGGLTVTSVSGVTFTRIASAPVRSAGAVTGWAFGVEMGMVQGTEVGGYEGAVVISGTSIAYGFGLHSATPGFVGSSFGAIWTSPSEGWVATSLTSIGQADTIFGGSCLAPALAGYGVTSCTPATLRGPGFNITASVPIDFPGNTAIGSRTMAFGPNRLRGAAIDVDCSQTTAC
jgi:hypothetical protein